MIAKSHNHTVCSNAYTSYITELNLKWGIPFNISNPTEFQLDFKSDEVERDNRKKLLMELEPIPFF